MILRRTKWAGAAMVLVGIGCSSNDTTTTTPVCQDSVFSRKDPNTDLGMYATFAAVPKDSYPSGIPAEVTVGLQAAVDAAARELTNRGLKQVDPSANPDLDLFSLSLTESQTSLYWQCASGWWYGYWIWEWDPCAWVTQSTVNYTVGMLLVGLADPMQKKVVFGGGIQGILECSDVQSHVDSSVAQIFSDYPTRSPAPDAGANAIEDIPR